MLFSIKAEYSNVFTENMLKLSLTQQEWKTKYHIPLEVLEESKPIICILKKPVKFSKNTVMFSLDIVLTTLDEKHYPITNVLNNTHLQSDFNKHIVNSVAQFFKKCQV